MLTGVIRNAARRATGAMTARRRSWNSSHETPGTTAGLGPGLNQVHLGGGRHARQRPQDQRLHPREHHGIDTDTHRQRTDDDGGDDRHAAHAAGGVAEIVPDGEG